MVVVVVGEAVGMTRAEQVSDEFWRIVAPLLPQPTGRAGRPWAEHRMVLEGICWRYRTGSPWRDVPVDFGSWQTVWKRHFLWSTDGTYQRMLDAAREAGLLDQAADEVDIEHLLSVDSTIVRAHQHAAGARRDSVSEELPATVEKDTGGVTE